MKILLVIAAIMLVGCTPPISTPTTLDADDLIREKVIYVDIPYKREYFGSGWRSDVCGDTRDRVLFERSLVPTDCALTGASWVDNYSGETYTNPGDVHIDHVVALAHAWRNGANDWTRTERVEFSNDVDNLEIVEGGANISKSDKSPIEWFEVQESYRCAFIGSWLDTKAKWDLAIDREEATRLAEIANEENCIDVIWKYGD